MTSSITTAFYHNNLRIINDKKAKMTILKNNPRTKQLPLNAKKKELKYMYEGLITSHAKFAKLMKEVQMDMNFNPNCTDEEAIRQPGLNKLHIIEIVNRLGFPPEGYKTEFKNGFKFLCKGKFYGESE